VFSDLGRLFVGDSKGSISVWDVELRHGKLVVENHFRLDHKELEGDQINSIKLHPDYVNQIFVQSRDNCVRLVQYESARGIRIKKRFFGSTCKDLMVRQATSPDGQYIIAGSEDGKPHVWYTSLEEMITASPYECKLLDLVSDVTWNPRYNMFAISGFGQHFPVLVYVYERSSDEL
jgi:jouberin